LLFVTPRGAYVRYTCMSRLARKASKALRCQYSLCICWSILMRFEVCFKEWNGYSKAMHILKFIASCRHKLRLMRIFYEKNVGRLTGHARFTSAIVKLGVNDGGGNCFDSVKVAVASFRHFSKTLRSIRPTIVHIHLLTIPHLQEILLQSCLQ